ALHPDVWPALRRHASASCRRQPPRRTSCVFCLLFCLMLRRPPRSTLFPTRRSSDLCHSVLHISGGVRQTPSTSAAPQLTWKASRSEEHTSELQSRENLVCRLLLEKKKAPHARAVRPRGLPFACGVPCSIARTTLRYL